MTIPEAITIGIVVCVAVLYVVRRGLMAVAGDRGSCKSCSNSCGCELTRVTEGKNLGPRESKKPKS